MLCFSRKENEAQKGNWLIRDHTTEVTEVDWQQPSATFYGNASTQSTYKKLEENKLMDKVKLICDIDVTIFIVLI